MDDRFIPWRVERNASRPGAIDIEPELVGIGDGLKCVPNRDIRPCRGGDCRRWREVHVPDIDPAVEIASLGGGIEEELRNLWKRSTGKGRQVDMNRMQLLY